jgi:ASC-1-like (ASCH) protein
LPLLRTKKEVFQWLKIGKKTIDVRKGPARNGEIAYFISGPHELKLKILRKESGLLEELVRSDNYQKIIPYAETLEEALMYLRALYSNNDGIFTSYYLDVQIP